MLLSLHVRPAIYTPPPPFRRQELNTKTVSPISVMYVSQQTTIPQVGAVASEHCAAMLAEVESLGLNSNGQFIFVSHGIPQDHTTRFTLDLCLPATKPAHYTGKYRFKELSPFDCANIEVHGPLSNLFSHGYGPLIRELHANNVRLSGQSRELYLEWYGPDSCSNRIELQIGVYTENSAPA